MERQYYGERLNKAVTARLLLPLRFSTRTPLGDILGDSGYAHRDAEARAIPLRAAGARTRAARPHRHQPASRRLGTHDRRARPVQARPPHQRRPRRLPPRAVPRRHGQDPLPAPPRLDDAGPGPARDPDVLAKTAQKHDYPSAAWRRSYSRRTGAERGFATTQGPRVAPPTTSAAAGAAAWASPR
jgi:hypothetical protein